MKYTLPALIALCLSASAYGEPASDSIVGKFELKTGNPDNSLEIHLECESETRCTFWTISQWKSNPPHQDRRALSKVRRVENLTTAINALNYAVGHQSLIIKNQEFAESMSKLRPVLSSGPSISKCWDLDYPSPEYLLVCTLANTPPDSPPIYLFGTLLANCGEGFCRYVINPMSRANSL
jgi:hypothetical protein